MKKEITITLLSPISYAHKGEQVEGSFVTVIRPKGKHLHLTSFLKKCFNDAVMFLGKNRSEQKEISGDESGDFNSEDAMNAIYAGGEAVDIKAFFLTTKELLTSGIVLLEGEEKLTKPLFDELIQEDVEKIIGEILVNFIVESMLTEKNGRN